IPVGPAAPADMTRVVVTADTAAAMDLVARVDMSPAVPGDQGVPNPEGQVDMASRADRGREAKDLSRGRVLLARMPMRLHLTAAGPLRMAVLLHLTLAHHPAAAGRPWDPTLRAEATRREERQPRVAVTRPAVVIRVAAATQAVVTREAVATRKRLRLKMF
ncbi:hypothetical protein, partial [Mycobacterium sp.]|uniref:hypothetical protein n=1 Tax=Mycobacterium sp. TaxID=1785 RepID=UPI003BAF8A15